MESETTNDLGAPEANFAGARVASFESRQQVAMEQLIRKHGGQPFVSPSMQEAPETDASSPTLQEFAHRLLDGSVDTVIAMTGVGFKYLVDVLSTRHPRQKLLDFLSDVTTIARGPKPNAAMHQLGVTATYKVAAPHTWRDILTLVDANGLANNRHIALLEYGETNPSLIAGLEARGANVLPVTIYRWLLPDDIEPLQANIRRLVAGEIDIAMFTSAQQVVHLMQVADALGCRSAVVGALNEIVVASIGPTTSERLQELGLPITLEPDQGKMARLVSAAAKYWNEQKPRASTKPRSSGRSITRETVPPALPTPSSVELSDTLIAHRQQAELAAENFKLQPWFDGPFLRACRREPTSVTPVWLMRQAGRYMQEYQTVRAQHTFLELCKNAPLCSEVMCTAVAKLGVDAAIIFSDLLPILEPLGFELSFGPGHGPKIHNPIEVAGDIDRVRPLADMQALEFVTDTVRLTRRDLPEHIPVIGFAGAPFTLASYCIEGGGSRSFQRTKKLMYNDPVAWHDLMSRLTDSVLVYLNAQVMAGAGCLQLFDSWVGALSPSDYATYVFPHVCRLVQGLARNVPVINFGTGNPQLLPYYAAAGPAVVGVDWRIELDQAWQWIGPEFAVQGNLDPLVLLGSRDNIQQQVTRILRQAANRPGHIFNLGHGIVPETPVDHAMALVDMVHQQSAR
ncbi:MAG: uroporphyrinogen decarboxylase [Planctomycetaceae bacterium]|nr:uroporphyrinogen decarboxylase [Planctomycetaceae bacterium]